MSDLSSLQGIFYRQKLCCIKRQHGKVRAAREEIKIPCT